jgi:hypothetical protein
MADPRHGIRSESGLRPTGRASSSSFTGRFISCAARSMKRRRLRSLRSRPCWKRNFALARVLKIDSTPGFVIGDQILIRPTELGKRQTIIRDTRRSKRSGQEEIVNR